MKYYFTSILTPKRFFALHDSADIFDFSMAICGAVKSVNCIDPSMVLLPKQVHMYPTQFSTQPIIGWNDEITSWQIYRPCCADQRSSREISVASTALAQKLPTRPAANNSALLRLSLTEINFTSEETRIIVKIKQDSLLQCFILCQHWLKKYVPQNCTKFLE